MPTYEYECDACGHEFELLQRMTDPAVRKCPKCTKLKVRRLISGGAGVIFKGSGFYETDYKRARGGAAAAKSDAGESKSESASESKSESSSSSSSEAKPSSADAKKPSEKSSDKPAPKNDAPKKKDG
jgi:putative FmdB family regulatory protein